MRYLCLYLEFWPLICANTPLAQGHLWRLSCLFIRGTYPIMSEQRRDLFRRPYHLSSKDGVRYRSGKLPWWGTSFTAVEIRLVHVLHHAQYLQGKNANYSEFWTRLLIAVPIEPRWSVVVLFAHWGRTKLPIENIRHSSEHTSSPEVSVFIPPSVQGPLFWKITA